jgi:hypothetical protein
LIKRIIIVLLVAWQCCFAATALANKNALQPLYAPPSTSNAWNIHHGFFLEGGIGSNAFYALLPSGSEGSFLGWGFGVAAGYHFLENIAIEAGFIYSTDLNADVEKRLAGITLTASAAARLYIPYVAFRFIVPVSKHFSVIFKLGGMYPYGTAKLSGSAAGIQASGRVAGDHDLPFTGVGMSYAMTPQLDLTVLYQGAVYVMASGAVLSAGLTYHF